LPRQRLVVFQIPVGVKTCGVHPGIGSALSRQVNILSSVNRQSFFEGFLNGDRIRLFLPTVIGSSIVG